jgi:hypothetical protein
MDDPKESDSLTDERSPGGAATDIIETDEALKDMLSVLIQAKPSLKIESVNKAGCFDIETCSLLAHFSSFREPIEKIKIKVV